MKSYLKVIKTAFKLQHFGLFLGKPNLAKLQA